MARRNTKRYQTNVNLPNYAIDSYDRTTSNISDIVNSLTGAYESQQRLNAEYGLAQRELAQKESQDEFRNNLLIEQNERSKKESEYTLKRQNALDVKAMAKARYDKNRQQGSDEIQNLDKVLAEINPSDFETRREILSNYSSDNDLTLDYIDGLNVSNKGKKADFENKVSLYGNMFGISEFDDSPGANSKRNKASMLAKMDINGNTEVSNKLSKMLIDSVFPQDTKANRDKRKLLDEEQIKSYFEQISSLNDSLSMADENDRKTIMQNINDIKQEAQEYAGSQQEEYSVGDITSNLIGEDENMNMYTREEFINESDRYGLTPQEAFVGLKNGNITIDENNNFISKEDLDLKLQEEANRVSLAEIEDNRIAAEKEALIPPTEIEKLGRTLSAVPEGLSALFGAVKLAPEQIAGGVNELFTVPGLFAKAFTTNPKPLIKPLIDLAVSRFNSSKDYASKLIDDLVIMPGENTVDIAGGNLTTKEKSINRKKGVGAEGLLPPYSPSDMDIKSIENKIETKIPDKIPDSSLSKYSSSIPGLLIDKKGSKRRKFVPVTNFEISEYDTVRAVDKDLQDNFNILKSDSTGVTLLDEDTKANAKNNLAENSLEFNRLRGKLYTRKMWSKQKKDFDNKSKILNKARDVINNPNFPPSEKIKMLEHLKEVYVSMPKKEIAAFKLLSPVAQRQYEKFNQAYIRDISSYQSILNEQ